MKRIIILISVAASLALSTACQDLKFGNDFLEKAPGVDITIDTIFSCKKYADRLLNGAYLSIPCGLIISNTAIDGESGSYDYRMNESSIGADNLDALTDILQCNCDWGGLYGMYYGGGYSAASENECGHTKFSYMTHLNFVWMGVRRCYLYMNNVDRVPDMSDEEKTLRKAEAKMIIALNYAHALRHIGGVPILYDAIDGGNSGADLSRKSVQEVADFICNLCDEAAEDLPWQVSRSDFGRLSKGAAMALKARVLLFIASPLFNAPEPFATPQEPTRQNVEKFTGDPKLMVWLGDYKQKRWQDAADACQAWIDANDASGNPYDLVMPTQNTAEGYRRAFSNCYANRCNGEVILSSGHCIACFKSAYYTQYFGIGTFYYGENGESTSGVGYGGGNVTLDYVEMFPNTDGTMTSYEDWCKTRRDTVINDVTYHLGNIDETPFLNKDPRLYESVCIVGDSFRKNRMESWIGGSERGDISNPGFSSGFATRKFLWDYDMDTYGNKPFCFPVLRVAEIYLSYAEALNELGRTADALVYLNKTRERVGLPPMTMELLDKVQPDSKKVPHFDYLIGNDKLREEILDERAREFMIEDNRWFDIARWKHGDILTKRLHGITMYPKSYALTDPKPEDAYLAFDEKSYIYEIAFSDPQLLYQRAWQVNFDPKWYLSAFPTDEINKGTGLTQNPGW